MGKLDLEKLIGHKRHKYGAVRTYCKLGHGHPSKAEAMHCWTLQAQINTNVIKDLEYEKKYELVFNGKLIGVHRPDFTYKRPIRILIPTSRDGFVSTTTDSFKICVDEVKGFKTADWILKSKLFVVLYPDIEYRVVG